MTHNPVKSVLGVLAPIFLLALVAIGWVVYELSQTVSSDSTIDVDRGSNLSQITSRLTATGVLPVNEFIFKSYALLTRSEGSIKAGQYAVKSGMSSTQVLSLIRSGDVIQYRLTFPEGLTFKQWQVRLASAEHLKQVTNGLSREQIAQALALPGDPEGWFFPDTYQYIKGTADIEILARAAVKMNSVLEAAWAKRSESIELDSPYEALVLASIIEKETGDARDRGKVASVFHNRLKRGMRLQTDPTVIYGLGDTFDGNLTRPHLRADTPYNSYTRHGLPPTPICSPGLEAIKDAMAGSYHPYLYFVARGDGTSEFSLTLDQHNKAVRTYQLKPNLEPRP